MHTISRRIRILFEVQVHFVEGIFFLDITFAFSANSSAAVSAHQLAGNLGISYKRCTLYHFVVENVQINIKLSAARELVILGDRPRFGTTSPTDCSKGQLGGVISDDMETVTGYVSAICSHWNNIYRR